MTCLGWTGPSAYVVDGSSNRAAIDTRQREQSVEQRERRFYGSAAQTC